MQWGYEERKINMRQTSGVVIMTEERLLKELYKVQDRIIAWTVVGVCVGLIIGWTLGVWVSQVGIIK